MGADARYHLRRWVSRRSRARSPACPIPQDPVSAATWRWAQASLPSYLLAHSVRSYCWGAEIAAWEGHTFDAQILWTAALFHDVGLTRIPRNTMCFEVEGAEIAREFLEQNGMYSPTQPIGRPSPSSSTCSRA